MEAIITKWVGKLITGLKLAAGGIVGRVMAYLGLSWVNFSYTMPEIKSWLLEKASGLSPMAHEYLSAFGVDIFMTLVVSAIVVKVGMKVFMTSVNALEGLVNGAGG